MKVTIGVVIHPSIVSGIYIVTIFTGQMPKTRSLHHTFREVHFIPFAAVWISVHIEAAPGFSVHVSGFRVTLQRIP